MFPTELDFSSENLFSSLWRKQFQPSSITGVNEIHQYNLQNYFPVFVPGPDACQQGGTAEDGLAFLPSNQNSAKLLPREKERKGKLLQTRVSEK